ncbi:MAG TPA: hypothetical protein VIM89_21080 [Mucilaginibacter sp.]
MHLPHKKNWFQKAWLKYTDRKAYINYKSLVKYYTEYNNAYALINKFVSENKDLTVNEILDKTRNSFEINLIHSGNSGDIIYSLPIAKKLSEMTSKPVNFLLKLDERMHLPPGDSHPLNNVMLNQAMSSNLIPLLKSQHYINEAEIYNGQQIHLNLSLFREAGLELDKGNIARWNFYTTGINADLSKPWINVQPDQEFKDSIVLARSSRYNNPLINYSFLADHDEVVFVGVKQEYDRMKKSLPKLYWHKVNDFLELAKVISGSKLFIGNQSFPFSVAEGLKTVRLLEVYHRVPNVIPEGENGYDFYFQKHFEYLVDSLVSNNKQTVYV